MPLDNTIIVVNDEPYLIWEIDLRTRNLEFIDGIDEGYFEYLLQAHLGEDDSRTPSRDEEKRTSIAIRTAYHHALETLFSLLGAFVQAPECTYAWIAKCSNRELRSVIRRITNADPTLITAWKGAVISWPLVSERILRCHMPDTDQGNRTRKLFSDLWQRLASEFLDENHIDEYNSLKHGFRIRSGGFALAMGVEHEYGVRPPDNEMNVIGHSDFGTTFFRLEPVGSNTKGDRNLRSRRVSLNWRIERVIMLFQLVSTSISNVKSALRVENGVSPGKCQFFRPADDDAFNRPWSFSTGVTSCTMDHIDPASVPQTSKKQLLEKLSEPREGH